MRDQIWIQRKRKIRRNVSSFVRKKKITCFVSTWPSVWFYFTVVNRGLMPVEFELQLEIRFSNSIWKFFGIYHFWFRKGRKRKNEFFYSSILKTFLDLSKPFIPLEPEVVWKLPISTLGYQYIWQNNIPSCWTSFKRKAKRKVCEFRTSIIGDDLWLNYCLSSQSVVNLKCRWGRSGAKSFKSARFGSFIMKWIVFDAI